MADENRTFDPTAQQANRSVEQGLGVGRKEMDAQRDASRGRPATDPPRTEPFDADEAAEETIRAATGARRGAKSDAERSQGRKTRAANKDIISRRT